MGILFVPTLIFLLILRADLFFTALNARPDISRSDDDLRAVRAVVFLLCSISKKRFIFYWYKVFIKITTLTAPKFYATLVNKGVIAGAAVKINWPTLTLKRKVK